MSDPHSHNSRAELAEAWVRRRIGNRSNPLEADDNHVQTGLLMLILEELRIMNRGGQGYDWESHAHWLNHVRPKFLKLIPRARKESERIGVLGCGVVRGPYVPTITGVQWKKRIGFSYDDQLEWLRKSIKECRAIRTVDDLIKLKGVGKVTLAKVKAAHQQTQGETDG